MTMTWVPVADVILRHGAEYCVLRDGKNLDTGTWYDRAIDDRGGWFCMGDEWQTQKESPVTHILNGEELPGCSMTGSLLPQSNLVSSLEISRSH